MPDRDMVSNTGLYEFSCKCCGDCCRKHGLYPVTSSDIVLISAHMNMGVDEFLDKFCVVATNDGRHGLFLRGINGTACPFLSGNVCSIHKFKPEVCRIFPDCDGYVMAYRLKHDLKDTTVAGSIGLSHCSIHDMPDDAILKGDIGKTIDFRIKEDTDRQYFASNTMVTSSTVKGLSSLATARLSDPVLRRLVAEKYSLIRRFYTGDVGDTRSLLQVERAILYRYLVTYASAAGLKIENMINTGVRATYVGETPGIAILCEGCLPGGVESAHHLYKRYGDTGIFSIAVISHGTSYVTSFTIETPCLDDIIRDDNTLHILIKFNNKRDIPLICKEGVP